MDAIELHGVDTEKQELRSRSAQGPALGVEVAESSPFQLSLAAESGSGVVLVQDNKTHVFVLVK